MRPELRQQILAAARLDEIKDLAKLLAEDGGSPNGIAAECSKALGQPVEVGEIRRWLGISMRAS